MNAAKQFGMTFTKRDEDDNIHIEDKMITNTTSKFKLLNICEFTSTRKRQSCIYRDSNGKIFLLCKGADSVIKERLTQASLMSDDFIQTERFVDKFASEGLRTLYLARREIPEDEYQAWNAES